MTRRWLPSNLSASGSRTARPSTLRRKRTMTRKIRASLILAAVAVGAGCLDDSITGTRPLDVEVSVSPSSALVGETVQATFLATGTGLQGVILDWGDGVVDSLALSGTAVQAGRDLDHAYSAVGSYTISARAEDQTGARTATTSVQIN